VVELRQFKDALNFLSHKGIAHRLDYEGWSDWLHNKVMAKKSNPREKTVTPRPIESLIHVIRGQKVMVDADLADMYGVPTGALNQAVRRNVERFPGDFAFRLSKAEFEHWKSQIVISNPSARMGLRHAPFVFTQEGVAMLSAVLRSDRAVQMSIAIVRTFVRMRELMAANKDIAARVEKLERGHDRTASVIEVLVEDIDRLARDVKDMKALPPVTKRRIGACDLNGTTITSGRTLPMRNG
jgi:ORF6N domain